MASAVEDPGPTFGSIIALEGDRHAIATQLRLLPPSSKILILPPFTDTFHVPPQDEPFNARAFILEVHDTLLCRSETAREFLKVSTSDQPRLVFMNGGSVSARMACVTAISERVTDGEIAEAEEIFLDIVKNGVAGLRKQDEGCEADDDLSIQEEASAEHMRQAAEDPSFVAMKAADSLDRDTADLDDGTMGLPRSVIADPEMEDASHADADGAVANTTSITIQSRKASLDDTRRNTFGDITPFTPQFCFTDAVSYQSDNEKELLSPRMRRGSAPPSPGLINMGEDCLVDGGGNRPLTRVNSVDRYTRTSYKDVILEQDYRPVRTPEVNMQPTSSLETLPRTVFVPISRQQSFETVDEIETATDPQIYSTADAGTQCPDSLAEVTPYEAVFAIFEDLVIHLTEKGDIGILDSIIRSYKNESYPQMPLEESDSASSPPTSPRSLQSGAQRPMSHMTAETDDDGYHRREEVDPYNPDSYQHGKRLWPHQETTKIYSQVTSKVAPPTPASTPPPTLSAAAQKFEDISTINATAVDVQNSLRSILEIRFPPETMRYRQYTYLDDNDRLWKPVFRSEDGNKTVDQILAIGSEDCVKKELFTSVVGQVGKLGTKKSGENRTGRLDIRYLITAAMQTHTSLPLHTQSTSPNPLANPSHLATLLLPPLEAYLAANEPTRFLLITYPASHLSTVHALRELIGQEVFQIAGIVDSSPVLKPKTPAVVIGLSNEAVASFNARSRSGNVKMRTRAEFGADTSKHPLGRVTVTTSISQSSSSNSMDNSSPPSFSNSNHILPSTATAAELSAFLANIRLTLEATDKFYIPEPEPKVPATAIPVTVIPVPPIPNSPSSPNSKNIPKTSERSPRMRSGSRGHSHHGSRTFGNASVGVGNSMRIGSEKDAREIREREVKDAKEARDKLEREVREVRERDIRELKERTEKERDAKERQSEKDWDNFYLGGDSDEEDAETMKRMMPREWETERRKPNTRKALKWLGLS